jgi:glycosyltransferase involved in cell wall biosynthesis
VQSVLNQSYLPIQLIVVDDASTDDSADQIQQLAKQYSTIEFQLLNKNIGNCKAFNHALNLAKGEYIIDLAADDTLLPNRVEVGVKMLRQTGAGVHFSDAEWIDEAGKHMYMHSDKFPHDTIPQGDIYKELISRYFICPPTMMFTREVIDYLHGYDESLTYEDFDFWIRSSRDFNYTYSSRVFVKKRVTANALARKQFIVFSHYSRSTFKVCEKILLLNRNKDEQQQLTKRIGYEIKLNLRLLNIRVVLNYCLLWLKNIAMKYD